MGVMSCSRKNCENIMCDRYSTGAGYICNDCFDELLISGIGTRLPAFMKTVPKHNDPQVREATYKYWDAIFSINEDEY